MQLLSDGRWVVSPSDLTVLSQCPWRLARVVDEKLGKPVTVPKIVDPMMDLVARLGLDHEKRQLELLKKQLPRVVEIQYDRSLGTGDAEAWKANITRSLEATVEAMREGADAVFQAVLYQEQIPGASFAVGFQGFADFIVFSDNRWEIWDTKLARSAKDSALIQLAAYVDQLHQLGLETSTEVRLILGDGTHSIHSVEPLIPAYHDQRDALLTIISQRAEDPEPTPWDDPTYVACGTKGCPACSEQIALNDDLFLIAGLRKTQRDKLRVAGFHTVKEFGLASRTEVAKRVYGIGRDTLSSLHLQASLQVATGQRSDGRPAWEILSAGVLRQIPQPDPGDVFFDFEGDPTYQEFDSQGRPLGSLSHGDESVWFGIEYLFGLWGDNLNPDSSDKFWALWAETFDEEKAVFEQFCDAMVARLELHPGMHIYHYASYERTRLLAMAARHNTRQDTVNRLLDGVLVDLYSAVMKGVRIGLPSYSLKALEALYFEPDTRTGIAGGGESVVAFSDYLLAKSQGLINEQTALRESILHYNRIDCFSTKALRDWLLDIRATST